MPWAVKIVGDTGEVLGGNDPIQVEGEIIISGINPPSTFITNQVVVTTQGTAEPLAASSTPLVEGTVEITALPTNTGLIYVGDSNVSSSDGHVLSPDKTTVFRTDDLSKIYVDTNTSGHGVSFVAH